MSFIDSIKDELTEDFNMLPFRAVCFGNRSMYIENVKGIKSYSLTKIELYLKKGQITITGENLFFKKYCMGDLAICGKISNFSIT